MNLSLENKVIIVSGGARGIGEGIVKTLLAEKAIPVVIDQRMSSIEGVKTIQADLTNPAACATAIEKIAKEFGTIDGLVNNAGVNDSVGLESGSHEAFTESIQRNLTHYYLMAHHALAALKKSKGAIVNIGSKTAFTGQGGTSGYAAANGGRNALTREWAVELLPYAIRVNCVVVAESFTPLYEKWINTFDNKDEKLAAITNKIPLEKRMTTTEEIANTVAFLLSERSSHTTGQLIYVDGGYTHLDRALNANN